MHTTDLPVRRLPEAEEHRQYRIIMVARQRRVERMRMVEAALLDLAHDPEVELDQRQKLSLAAEVLGEVKL